ncbi:MAG: response regulator, partial [bacterium]
LGLADLDPGQIEQILMNLIVNARDAMPEGGKIIIETDNVELSAEYVAKHVGARPGPHVMMAVSDTGYGMDQEVQRRIFEPFFTTKDVGKGTGLGLSTVYGIVKQSRGCIYVYSEPGEGTTFKVYFPCVEGAAKPDARKEDMSVSLRGEEMILLVEDDEYVRRCLSQILAEYGYGVLTAKRGSQALEAAKQHTGPIDLLLTDVIMPGMSGWDLAKELVSRRPETKVLFVSGYTDDAIAHHRVFKKGIHFIEKPVMPETLARKVREVLDTP